MEHPTKLTLYEADDTIYQDQKIIKIKLEHLEMNLAMLRPMVLRMKKEYDIGRCSILELFDWKHNLNRLELTSLQYTHLLHNPQTALHKNEGYLLKKIKLGLKILHFYKDHYYSIMFKKKQLLDHFNDINIAYMYYVKHYGDVKVSAYLYEKLTSKQAVDIGKLPSPEELKEIKNKKMQ